jgi:hypothetical protein
MFRKRIPRPPKLKLTRERALSVFAATLAGEPAPPVFSGTLVEQAIFTANSVKHLTPAQVAQLLNDCWYDLLRTERRLLLDPSYDEMRSQARRR